MANVKEALQECCSMLLTATEYIRLVLDGKASLREIEWEQLIKPLHEEALRKAEEALAEYDATDFKSPTCVKPLAWVNKGELNTDDLKTLEDAVIQCGCIADDSCSHEILCSPQFLGDDGHVYQIGLVIDVCRIEPDELDVFIDEDDLDALASLRRELQTEIKPTPAKAQYPWD